MEDGEGRGMRQRKAAKPQRRKGVCTRAIFAEGNALSADEPAARPYPKTAYLPPIYRLKLSFL